MTCDLHVTLLNYISEANNMYFLIIKSLKITQLENIHENKSNFEQDCD